jgi:aminopeptidase YwaD
MINSKKNRYVEHCLSRLSVGIGARPAGSQANLAAADFIAGEMKQAGYEVVLQKYPCPDWQPLSCELTAAGKRILAAVNTYSPSCDVEAELVAVSSIDDLRHLDVTNKVAALYGDITRTSFLPRNFDRRYHVVESQDRFLELLENSKPSAIVTVNHYNGPRPVLLEDSDFIIPSVTVSRQDGLCLVQNAGATARLRIISERRESAGSNVIGRRRGNSAKKIVVCAHYDTKPGTPGAMDNAAGISALLLLAWHLKQVETELAIEFVAYGGEDSWWPGDALYIEEYPPENIVAAINIDGIGMKSSNTAIAFFECPESLAGRVMDAAGSYGDFVTEQFYASDHCFFWPLGIPTLALTTSGAMDLVGTVIHTENDRPDLLDNRKIEQTAGLLRDIILMLD